MDLTALRRAVAGALGFLTRIPVGRSSAAWEAFQRRPATMVVVGYLVGTILAVIAVVPLPAVTIGVVFPGAIITVLGINHLDGLADCGDAAAVHGPPEERRQVLKDTTLGIGGITAVGLVLIGLALAGIGLASLPARITIGIVIAAEVGADLGMALLAYVGTAAHDGLGAQLIEGATADQAVVPVVLAGPALLTTLPSPAAASAVGAALLVTAGVARWARRALGGISGDSFGAAHELARVAGLHCGIAVWMAL